MSATVISAGLIAGLQGLLGGLLFAVLGLSAPVFWGVVMGFLCLLPFGAWMYEHRLWTVPMDTWWGWVAMFLCTEFFYYWMHRAGHRIRWYWASHQVHHSGNQYNLAAAFRQSITGKVTGCFVFFAPQCLFGFSPDAVLISYGLNLVYQFWIHTDLVPKLGWMEGVFNTPSAHRVHHAANVELVRLIEHACDQQTAQTVPHQMQRARTQRITKRRKPARVFREIQPHRWVAVAVHGVAVVFDAPRHPYTRALVAAVPVPDPDQPRAPLPIHGNVPDAREPPSGCSFRDRCPHAFARCAEEEPPMREIAPGSVLYEGPAGLVAASTVPSIRGVVVASSRRFASRRSSGRPVSFHQPSTISARTAKPSSISHWMASVISYSPRQDGVSVRHASRTESRNRYTPTSAMSETNSFGFSTRPVMVTSGDPVTGGSWAAQP